MLTYIGLGIGYKEGNLVAIKTMELFGVNLAILLYVFIMILSTTYLIYMTKYKYWRYISPIAILIRISLLIPILFSWTFLIW